jgi:multidrug efflux pump subunit AcrB
VKWEIPYDSSRFVKISISQVVETLVEAVALVFLVMFLFLQNWRYTIIPTSWCRSRCWAPSPRCWRWASRSTC